MLYAVMIPAVICAYLVKGMCGFANTLVFSTMMSFTANNVQILRKELLKQSLPTQTPHSKTVRRVLMP